MSIEKLQEKIRKVKNPVIVDLTVAASQIPLCLIEKEDNLIKASQMYIRDLLYAFKGKIPAVRFSYMYYALHGPEGITTLLDLMHEAKNSGFYVLLDFCEGTSGSYIASAIDQFCNLPCDGFIITAYTGSDAVQPYVKKLKETGKSLFVVIRSANKSASQLQDLMTGSRLAHMASADMIKRLGEQLVGKSGYSQVAGVCAATAPSSMRSLREKYKNVFLLVDGVDYPGGNAKNCGFAFDKLGHGAVVCVSDSVLGAWKEAENDDYCIAAINAAERLRKNLLKYITIL